MYRTMSVLLLSLLANNVIADWEKLPIHAENLTAYADPTSIRKTGDTVTMTSLYDFNQTQSGARLEPYLSETFLIEYNCTNERRRVLGISNFSKHMGLGEEVFAYHDVGSWTPFELGSLSESLWNFACRKH